jgi:hypothetical protein
MDGGSLADFLKTVRTVPEAYLAAICKQASEMSHNQPQFPLVSEYQIDILN